MLSGLRRIHGRFYEWKTLWKNIFELKKRIQLSDKKTLLFIMTPVHGNIGDQAIAKVTTELLVEMNIKYIEVTVVDLLMLEKIHSISILNERNILVHGGGYFGTLWPELDDMFRRIIVKIPDSRILCFPNTFYYNNTPEGQNRLKRSVEVFNSHQHIKFCARERISFDLVCHLYNDVVLMPDIVLSKDKSKKEQPRNGCLICFRNDKEKTLKPEEYERYKSEAESIFNGNVKITDIDGMDYIPIEKRNEAITEKLNEFISSELVVTDRLHGMIFCAITGTPCIVINSKSHKVKGSYEWIKHLEYIILAEKEESLIQLVNKIPNRRFYYDNTNLQPYYAELKKYITDIVND